MQLIWGMMAFSFIFTVLILGLAAAKMGWLPNPTEECHPRTCRWVMDSIDWDAWKTDCGSMFVIIDGTPKDNDMHFCSYCGGKLVQEVLA